MTRVFAALIFLCLISGCTKFGFQKSFYQDFNSDMKIIYSAPGDFNGDGKKETIYLLNSPDGKYYLSLRCSNKTCEALLKLNIKIFSAWVEDVDGNKKDDFILSSISGDTPLLYVFTYDENIKLIVSPSILKNKINLKNIVPHISSNNFADKKNTIISKIKNAVLLSTDIDIIPGESLFTCDYALSDDNKSLDCLSVCFTINSKGTINIIDVHEFKNQTANQWAPNIIGTLRYIETGS